MAGVRAMRVTRKTGNYTALVNDCVVVDASGGAVTITLPAAYLGHESILVKKVDSSGNAVTVARAGSDTIDGAATYSLATQYKYVEVIAETAKWHVIANN